MADELRDNINDPLSDEEILKDLSLEKGDEKDLEKESEKEFLAKVKKKNKEFLIAGLSPLEKERIAKHIKTLVDETQTKHKELEDRIDEYDIVHRMQRQEMVGSDGDMPNYTMPLTTVTQEVIHANVMNVFFTPKDIMRVLPTEEGDVPKVKKISTFGNWSMKNELNLFEQIDRLFHSSAKNGEAPYMVHWVKEYGVDIIKEPLKDPSNMSRPMIDPDTKEPLFTEREEAKLLYNAPKLEIFSRKDYIQPLNSLMDKAPNWEARKIRITFDAYLREQLQGKMYPGSIDDITDWSSADSVESNKEDFEGDTIPVGKWEKQFIEWHGRLRIRTIKQDDEDDTPEIKELEDEFIAIINMQDETLCQLRKNKFPLKKRPFGIDYFIPDDDGRRAGIGIFEFMRNLQKAYDALWNQFLFGVIQANAPVIFFTPFGNQRKEPTKIRAGYMYPTSDAKNMNVVKFPSPDSTLQAMLELIQQWAQLLFGISPFTAGVESKIDPDAPAKKAEIVVAQGNVRLNAIIKRKNATLKDIFLRWFLLYKENMPPNKFMRITGSSENNPWKFDGIALEDFALKSLPDFELIGNILNSNKSFQANKAIGIYNILVQNPFFSPQTSQGLQGLHSLTKWLIDQLDETGLSRFIPEIQGQFINTPEEENARFLQGDVIEPSTGEDHINHVRVHNAMLLDPSVPDDVKRKFTAPHIQSHGQKMKEEITQRLALQQAGIDPDQAQAGGQQAGGQNVVPGRTPQPARAAPGNVVPREPAGVAGLTGRI